VFFQPHSLDEALEMKAHHGADAAFVAGGTDVVVMMNHGRLPARVLIDLSHISGTGVISVSPEGARCTAGGGATFAALARVPVRCLAQAALSVGGPQIRNRATIAGNLASASPAGDGSTALLALDADVTLRSLRGARTLPLREFFLGYRATDLAPDEIIESVAFPTDWRTAWYKLGKRGAMNISLVCCAVGLAPDGRACVAFGSVAPFPMRAPRTEGLLARAIAAWPAVTPLPETALREILEAAEGEVRPVDDFRGSADYRRAMSATLLRKCLRDLKLCP
jgi:CO/xanthine dehydrogenase FAD-binding subunit